MKFLGARLLAGLSLLASPALAADKVSFGTNWLPEAEHGGYYQALADGTYAKYGLDVTIVPGGPQANNELLLAAGRLDFYMGGNLLLAFDAVARDVPIVVVAAHFQKDPQIFMSHPGQGLDKWTDLPSASQTIIGKEGLVTFYQWMKQAYGFKEDNVRPYTFNPGPFIADPHSIQQGYVTSEPFAVEREGHFKPNIFLFADNGYKTYATTVETRADLVASKPDLVQRFIDASTIGWYNYLYGDNAKANAAIKSANPEMTDEQIAFSIGKIKEYGLVNSGDTLKLGDRRDDRRADQGFLRLDGQGRGGQAGRRLQEVLHPPVRQQGRRSRPASEVSAYKKSSDKRRRKRLAGAPPPPERKPPHDDRPIRAPRCQRYALEAGARAWALARRDRGPLNFDGFATVDILVDDGAIARQSRRPGAADFGDAPQVALSGRIVLPLFVDAHTHIDKGHIWRRKRNPVGDFPSALAAAIEDRSANWNAADVAARMEFSLRSAYAYGTTALRTHIDSVGAQTRISLAGLR